MKKVILTIITILFSIVAFAQKDVTMFLGIPVDGTKLQMKTKLIAKGFKYDVSNDCFTGQFNGAMVNLFVAENNGKVCRIMLSDQNGSSETDIKIRFNRLVRQFENNEKYIPYTMNDDSQQILDGEDISYEMLCHNKRYEALFYQNVVPELLDTTALRASCAERLSQKYTEEEMANPTEEQKAGMDQIISEVSFEYYTYLLRNKSVWFMISEYYGEYYITMFYDNEYNKANGEDL